MRIMLNLWLTTVVIVSLLAVWFYIARQSNAVLLTPLVFVGLVPIAVFGWCVTPPPDKWRAAFLGPVLAWIVAFVFWVILMFDAMYHGMRC
jgi:hypothetical protein